jgi:hypothetical protein
MASRQFCSLACWSAPGGGFSVPAFISLVAAVVAVMAAAIGVGRWLWNRRVRLTIDVTFQYGPSPDILANPPAQGQLFAIATVRNAGKRSVVVTEFGVVRCRSKPRRGRIRDLTDEIRTGKFDLSKWPRVVPEPEPGPTRGPLWGYARITADGRSRVSKAPLRVPDDTGRLYEP